MGIVRATHTLRHVGKGVIPQPIDKASLACGLAVLFELRTEVGVLLSKFAKGRFIVDLLLAETSLRNAGANVGIGVLIVKGWWSVIGVVVPAAAGVEGGGDELDVGVGAAG